MSKFAAIAAVCLGLMLAPGLSVPAEAQTVAEVPLVPLAPSDMTAAELATYRSLSDPAAQMSFRDSRAFLRLCQQVVAGTLQPLSLPNTPKDYDDKYLDEREQKIVTDALIHSIQFSQ